jgi:hypothetical protein
VRSNNHSQFANDTLLLGEASSITTTIFKVVLNLIIRDSGGLVNNNKSCFFAWNVTRGTLLILSRILMFSFHEEWHSFRYLGMPITTKSSNSQFGIKF